MPLSNVGVVVCAFDNSIVSPTEIFDVTVRSFPIVTSSGKPRVNVLFADKSCGPDGDTSNSFDVP